MMQMNLQNRDLESELNCCLYVLPYLKWITSKDLLYSTYNLLSVMWQSGWEGNLREHRYMYT